MGDVVHTLPALDDLKRYREDCEVSWVVEEAFTEILSANPNVDRVIPIALRRWRRNWLASLAEIRLFLKAVRAERYDVIIDPQGLIKSGLVTSICRLTSHGKRVGYDKTSIKESLASIFYSTTLVVSRQQHAIARTRQLFAYAFGYDNEIGGIVAAKNELAISSDESSTESGDIQYGFAQLKSHSASDSIMFLHGTTWASKHWPDEYWCELAQRLVLMGYTIVLPQASDVELARAKLVESYVNQPSPLNGLVASDQSTTSANQLTSDNPIRVLPRGGLAELFEVMQQCAGFVSVDTGLGHLACALEKPLVGLYGSTDPSLTGPTGRLHAILASEALSCIPCMKRKCQYDETGSDAFPPCFQDVSPTSVVEKLTELMGVSQ